jgi:hypothetical protein
LLWFEQVATYDFQVATSYYGHRETERHVGLGTRASVDVVVEFAGSANLTRINNVAANQMIRVIESQITPPALTGDYNSSGKVDAADYVVWRHLQGTNVPPFGGADGDGDGDVDGEDYNVWRARFGMTKPALANAEVMNVPASGPASIPIGPISTSLSSEKIALPKAAHAAAVRAADFAGFDRDLTLLAADRVERLARNDAATTIFGSRVDFAKVPWNGEGLHSCLLRSLIQAAACPWFPVRTR